MPTLEIIPPSLYSSLFQWTLLALVAWVISACRNGGVYRPAPRQALANATRLFVCVFTILVALRPVSAYFGDAVNYARSFYQAQAGGSYNWIQSLLSFKGECIFSAIQDFCLEYGNLQLLFTIFALLYFGSQYLATRRLFGPYWPVPYLAMASMIDYWGFAVNGIRNGAAANIMILALTWRDKKSIAIPLALISCGIHKSMLLVAGSAILARYYTKTKAYFALWLACIGLASIGGSAISSWLSHSFLSSADDRLAAYMAYSRDQDMMSQFSSAGFRPDFLLYSAVPIITGYWFLNIRKQDAPRYRWWLNTYIIANSFWVLNMYSFSSNRFAALSWFMAGVVLMYPFFKLRLMPLPAQARAAACALACWYVFDFYQNIVRTMI